MQRLHTLALTLVMAAGFSACGGSAGPEGGDDDRHPLGKADNIGSCATEDGDTCGGPSDGTCWCDDQCELFGDCCADKAAVCDGGGGDGLCLGDGDCNADQVCDHSECLSGCPEGGICPAVCFGACVPDGGEPKSCGGIAGLVCDEGDFCQFSEDQSCGFADQLGTCTTPPEVCAEILAPVCGCDGKTYDNECSAHGAGVNVDSPGACPNQACGGFAGIQCTEGNLCVDDPDDSCDPLNGGADCPGVCIPEIDCKEDSDCPDGQACTLGGICLPGDPGEECGGITCGVGQVCCNPLLQICTAPGEFCIFGG